MAYEFDYEKNLAWDGWHLRDTYENMSYGSFANMRNFRTTSNGTYNDVMNLGALPQNYYFSGSAAAGSETVDGVMRNLSLIHI